MLLIIKRTFYVLLELLILNGLSSAVPPAVTKCYACNEVKIDCQRELICRPVVPYCTSWFRNGKVVIRDCGHPDNEQALGLTETKTCFEDAYGKVLRRLGAPIQARHKIPRMTPDDKFKICICKGNFCNSYEAATTPSHSDKLAATGLMIVGSAMIVALLVV